MPHDALAALYRPIATAAAARARAHGPGFVIGLCGPQGSGKSTGALVLQAELAALGLGAQILSIDDLYLTHARRQALAAEVHPLLATRGPPGTHDAALGLAVLDALAGPGPAPVALPRFDKAADDRLPQAQWPTVQPPVDVVIFEGWCVGARPQPPEALEAPINALEAERDPTGAWRRFVNQALAQAYQTLFARIGFLILLQPPGFAVVEGWRIEQEHALAEAHPGAPGVMSDDEVRRFVQHYERLTRWVMAEMPGRADVVVELDERRVGRG